MADSVIDQGAGQDWCIYNADCVEAVGNMPDDSVGFSVFSPPFASLYTYSNSERDMGNCASYDDFWVQFGFLIDQLYRVLKPGRQISVHCMNLPTTKTHHGHIGIQDFRGDIIRRFEKSGFHYHSEVCVWKDPVTAMQRTKAIGLLHKQLCKDSCLSRQGVPDYVCTFRKPGENPEPVAGELDYFAGDQSTFKVTGRLSIDVWQRYASPVWMDINPSNTLQYTTARDEEDERHICPLQLDVIERCIQLWSNLGDVVLSPFAGIGSEGHVAIKTGRKFVGVELKPSYYRIACQNLRAAEDSLKEQRLF
jgi:DNA modification methylase